MEDVQVVLNTVFRVFWAGLILIIAAGGLLWMQPAERPRLLQSISRGGWGTLGIIGTLVIILVLSWDFYFDSIHALFFAPGTWQFYNSDTLIRLYPQQFWFDTSMIMAVLTISAALVCGVLPSYYYARRPRK